MPPRISLEEQEKILTEATRLLAEPANYIVGRWKCPVFKRGKDGRILHDEDGKSIPEIDLFNRPIHEHCIEGAVNQAAYNVLGEKRAATISDGEPGYYNFENCAITERLGLNALTRELYDDGYDTAMDMNDSFDHHDPEGHKLVLGLLKEQLGRVHKKIAARR